MICPICLSPIFRGNKITIVSSGVEAINDLGEYNIIPDFLQNEQVYHMECFESRFNSNDKHNTDNVVKILRAFGENVTEKQVEEFLNKTKCDVDNMEELIRTWHDFVV